MIYLFNLIISNNEEYKKSLIYTFYYLLKPYNESFKVGDKYEEGLINVFYGFKDKSYEGIYIKSDEESCLDLNDLAFVEYNNKPVFSLKKVQGKLFEVESNRIIFNFDILKASLVLITCFQEYIISARDTHERFLGEYSKYKQYNNVPLFDIQAEVFFDILNQKGYNTNQRNNKVRIMLTHDVDNLSSRHYLIFLHNIKELLTNKDKQFTLKLNTLVEDVIKNKFDNFDECIALERQVNAKSEFYFLQGVKHRYGRRYKLNEMENKKEYFSKQNGYVPGIHTNYFSYNDENKIKIEKKEIDTYFEDNCNSSRNHYLRFKVPESWSVLKNAKIEYDCSLGYSDVNGFRAATGQSFIPYDMNKNDIIEIIEIPLVYMDIINMEGKGSQDIKFIRAKSIIDILMKYGATVSILHHPSALAQNEDYKMYKQILSYLKENNVEFITTRDLSVERHNEINTLKKLLNIQKKEG